MRFSYRIFGKDEPATQLPHYVMPGFAAFFLILARSLEMPDVWRH